MTTPHHTAAGRTAAIGRIGPNVLIQTARTLEHRLGRDAAERLLVSSTAHSLATLPGDMVDERDANALMQRVLQEFGVPFARTVMRESGTRTGDYLLAHRIPKPAQWVLPWLPGPLGLRVLLGAIGKHTWTFAGSATVHITHGDPAVLTLQRCPLCRGRHATEPICDFYTATFERLARVLLGPNAWAEEVSCEARGDTSCRFLISSGG